MPEPTSRDRALAAAAALPRGRWFLAPGGVVLYVARRPRVRGCRLMATRTQVTCPGDRAHGYRITSNAAFTFRTGGDVTCEDDHGPPTRARSRDLAVLARDLEQAVRWPRRARRYGAGVLTGTGG
jgi:hypothetical protein